MSSIQSKFYEYIWSRYRMTGEQFEIFTGMKKGCWICGRTKKKNGDPLKLFTDHDHKTGRVRGRLCYACNRRLIGRRREGSLYRKAADYLDSKFDGRYIETASKPVRLRRRVSRTNGDAR